MKNIHTIVCFLLLGVVSLRAQTPHQVINSAGQDRVSPSLSLTLTDNVGEAFVQAVNGGTNSITQGFLQYFSIAQYDSAVVVLINPVSCHGNKDGNITVSSSPIYSVSYLWSDTLLCPSKNCSNLDSLGADTLYLTVIVKRPLSGGGTISDTIRKNFRCIVTDPNPPCNVTIYNGVTANGDNANDYFYIKNIEEYPNNRLTIYNRWGNKLYDVNNYNNSTIRWPEGDDLRILTSGTYFYVLELGDNASVIKGWIELLKN